MSRYYSSKENAAVWLNKYSTKTKMNLTLNHVAVVVLLTAQIVLLFGQTPQPECGIVEEEVSYNLQCVQNFLYLKIVFV